MAVQLQLVMNKDMTVLNLQVMGGWLKITIAKVPSYHIYVDKEVSPNYILSWYIINSYPACNSTNGLTCSEPTVEPGPAVLPEIIAVIVIIVVIIIAVVAIIISLLLMWKYRNDAFYRYILCCVYGGSKTQVNNLKQENIRLRNELSQQKLNLNASGHLQGLCK